MHRRQVLTVQWHETSTWLMWSLVFGCAVSRFWVNWKGTFTKTRWSCVDGLLVVSCLLRWVFVNVEFPEKFVAALPFESTFEKADTFDSSFQCSQSSTSTSPSSIHWMLSVGWINNKNTARSPDSKRREWITKSLGEDREQYKAGVEIHFWL